ncbi:SufE family protein [Bauldia sp.]|uniref:SufE family protein n=1 Tax=Bauldia sp. TaxID=2575872 RepID=UPI003BA9635A
MDQAVTQSPAIDDIVADFELLDEWEDRYRYVIELGRSLAPLADDDRTEANKVRGCASQVWLATEQDGAGPDAVLCFRGDSDAMIVRGLVAIVIALFGDRTADEILKTDAEALFQRLDLRSHLTAQRSNGLRSLVDRIRADAASAIGDAPTAATG